MLGLFDRKETTQKKTIISLSHKVTRAINALQGSLASFKKEKLPAFVAEMNVEVLGQDKFLISFLTEGDFAKVHENRQRALPGSEEKNKWRPDDGEKKSAVICVYDGHTWIGVVLYEKNLEVWSGEFNSLTGQVNGKKKS